MKPEDVILEFGKLTGLPFRVLPHYVQKQAATFARSFQLWELRVTIEWVKVMIREAESGQRNGFSRLSLQWRNMFRDDGDESLETFQQRLGLALEWAKKHRKDLLPRQERAEAAPEPIAAPQHDSHVWAWHAQSFREMRQEMAPSKPTIVPKETLTWAERKALAEKHGDAA